MIEIDGTSYSYSSQQLASLEELAERVGVLRKEGSLNSDVLYRLRKYFKIKNIYHSNAIEGNSLDIGETRQVVEIGLTITGKSLKDQAEAKNLAAAIDFLEELASENTEPITAHDIRQIHALVLKDINDRAAGGYRQVEVEISGSSYKPPRPECVPGEMESFGSWLKSVSCPGENFATIQGVLVAAVAHTWLVYIHPFIDGNGRVARLLMNLVLMRYGFPIAVITKDDRLRYYDALETSQTSDLSGFVALIAECIRESLEEYESAAKEQRDRVEWAKSLAGRFSQQELVRTQNEYEVWKSAMDLLKGYMRQTAALIDESAQLAAVYFRDFGELAFEKYLSIYQGESAKKTWFFRLDFRRGDRIARYLFFFGYRSLTLQKNCKVTLHIAREEPPGSFSYDRLLSLSAPNVPTIVEIGYDASGEAFLAHTRSDKIQRGKIEDIGRQLFEDVIKLHFST